MIISFKKQFGGSDVGLYLAGKLEIMELSKIDKAAKILEEVKKLDAEIIQLDRIAMLIANDGGEAEFELTVKEYKKPEDEKAKLDDDGSLIPLKSEDIIRKYATGFWFSWETPKKSNDDDKTTAIKNTLSATNTLAILGVLLRDKTEKRAVLINKLEKMGFKI